MIKIAIVIDRDYTKRLMSAKNASISEIGIAIASLEEKKIELVEAFTKISDKVSHGDFEEE